jgi:hypothetical protein
MPSMSGQYDFFDPLIALRTCFALIVFRLIQSLVVYGSLDLFYLGQKKVIERSGRFLIIQSHRPILQSDWLLR